MSTAIVAHTPGPWIIHEPATPVNPVLGYRVGPADSPGLPAAHVMAGMATENAALRLAHAEANARLIAAAPELLRAAKNIVDCYTNELVDQHESCWTDLEAAIAKAEFGVQL